MSADFYFAGPRGASGRAARVIAPAGVEQRGYFLNVAPGVKQVPVPGVELALLRPVKRRVGLDQCLRIP